MKRRLPTWFYHPGAIATGWLAWLLGGTTIIGAENVPDAGAFILVANHCSNLDPPILGWAVGHRRGRTIHFLAKDEMRHWPVVGWLATQAGVIFVKRGSGDRGAQLAALEALAGGQPIAVFPEGTRSKDGHLAAAKPGAALLGMRSGAPFLPVGIAGTHRIFGGGRRIPRRTHMTIRIGVPFTLPATDPDRLDRSALAAGSARIMDEIDALLPPEQRRVTAGAA